MVPPRFTTEGGKKFTITILNPREDLNQAEVLTVPFGLPAKVPRPAVYPLFLFRITAFILNGHE
ncbi:MAG: hypothetical protein VR66_05455 [Peptococcaceae bacterium BRH_c23]|nr:DUF2922 domain-containing protein [Desulfosporosinus sp. BICA1-9]KJS49974.1 MAG: hypothetical protein VR66_05455 [Peptococcaceae bacterium BRH_c23]KJS79194.1 MAG: hypothetical protein JL57_30270 [Desulfosporosinus sp. BICA1-9]